MRRPSEPRIPFSRGSTASKLPELPRLPARPCLPPTAFPAAPSLSPCSSSKNPFRSSCRSFFLLQGPFAPVGSPPPPQGAPQSASLDGGMVPITCVSAQALSRGAFPTSGRSVTWHAVFSESRPAGTASDQLGHSADPKGGPDTHGMLCHYLLNDYYHEGKCLRSIRNRDQVWEGTCTMIVPPGEKKGSNCAHELAQVPGTSRDLPGNS